MSDVLVLGAGGFIGQQLVRALAAQGRSVLAVGRSELHSDLPEVTTVKSDLATPEAFVPYLQDCEVVVHAASTSTPGSSAGQPLRELDTNLRTTLSLLQAMQQIPRKLLYLSSGGSLYAPTNNQGRMKPRYSSPAPITERARQQRNFSSQHGVRNTQATPSYCAPPTSMDRARANAPASASSRPHSATCNEVKPCTFGAMARRYATIYTSMISPVCAQTSSRHPRLPGLPSSMQPVVKE